MLHDPGREFHVMELLDRGMDVLSLTAGVAANGLVRRGLYATIPVLDAKAKAQLKSRLNDLRQELNEAERFNDFQRKTQAQNELQAIAEYLTSAVGVGCLETLIRVVTAKVTM
jgi:basic membrane lipoprotein Med (substrate-binding protein (PBP1-ABC) superfamily)